MDTSAFENGGATAAAATVVPLDGLHSNNDQLDAEILLRHQNYQHQHRIDAEGMNGISTVTSTVQTKIDGTSSSSSPSSNINVNGHHHSCDDGPANVKNINGSVHHVDGTATIQSNGNRNDHTNVYGSIDAGVGRNDRTEHDELKSRASVAPPPTPTSGTTIPSTTSTPIGLTIASDRVTYTDDAIIAKYTYVLHVNLPLLNMPVFIGA